MQLRKLLLLPVILLTGSPLSMAQTPSGDTKPSVVDIVALVDEGKYREAQMLVNTLLVDGCTDDALYYYQGVCRMNTAEVAAAEESFLKAFAADTANVWYCSALITYYSAMSRPHELCEYYARARVLDPGQFGTPYHLTRYGDALRASRRPKEAEAVYREAFGQDQDCLEALLGLCEVKLGTQDYASFFALSDYFVKRPDIPSAFKGEYIENVFGVFNKDMFAWWHESMDSLVLHCVAAAPDDSTCVGAAARWFYATGRTEQGIGWFERLAQICPSSSAPRLNLVGIKMNAGDYAGAIAQCRQVLEAGYPDVDRSSVLGLMADCYDRLGEEKEAFSHYELALKANPDNTVALNNYAYKLSLSGRKLAKAEKMAARVIELEPDNPTYLDTYGWILHARGKDEQARKVFKRAMVYGGKDHTEILEHYSAVLDALGEKDLATYYKNLSSSRKTAK